MRWLLPLILAILHGWQWMHAERIATEIVYNDSSGEFEAYDGSSWTTVGGGTDDQTASEVPVTDSGGNYTGTDVEAVLAEVATTLTTHASDISTNTSDVATNAADIVSKLESDDNKTLASVDADNIYEVAATADLTLTNDPSTALGRARQYATADASTWSWILPSSSTYPRILRNDDASDTIGIEISPSATVVDTLNPGDIAYCEYITGNSAWDIQVVRAAGVFRTIYIDAGAMIPRTTSGPATQTEEYATNDIMSDQLLFAGDATEGAQFKLMMPDEWNLGTVKVKVFWDADTGASAADLVSFDIAAGALSNDDAIDAALGTAVEVDDVVLAVGDLHVSPASAALTIGGTPALGDLVVFQIERDHDDAADNMTEDLKLLGVAIQYQELTSVAAEW